MSESIDLHSQKFEPHIPAAASLQPLSMLKSYRLLALNIEERMLERECFERRRQRKGPCHGVTRRSHAQQSSLSGNTRAAEQIAETNFVMKRTADHR